MIFVIVKICQVKSYSHGQEEPYKWWGVVDQHAALGARAGAEIRRPRQRVDRAVVGMRAAAGQSGAAATHPRSVSIG